MLQNSKKSYNGVYVPRDDTGAGHLTIAGKDTSLKLVSKERWKATPEEFRDHHGVLTDGTRASLLECVPIEETNYRWNENARHELNLFPHYILIGETFINSQDAVISTLHYHFENVNSLVNGFGTFGTIHPEPDDFLRIIEADHNRNQQIAMKNGWPTRAFDPHIGEQPILLYYNGVWEIAKCDAMVGKVALKNRITHGMGDSEGVGIDNAITVTIEFANPKTIGDAASSLGTVHSFFELCLGRRQRYRWIEAELANEKPEKVGAAPPRSALIWSYCNERVSGDTRRTSYGDILLDPGAQKAEFAKVLSGWLDSTPSMGEARDRFATAFHADSYGIDRIVGAANMFDLLPNSHAPAKKKPDKQIQDAVDECRKRFKALPESFARDSLLSALGRVGNASLRDKVCHRADILMSAAPNKFPELHLPCSQAILCRNHYVHGSDAAFDYRDEFGAFAFLTDTLEFVFAVSDLIELGWGYESWRDKGSSLTHNFGSYAVHYHENLTRLKALIKR